MATNRVTKWAKTTWKQLNNGTFAFQVQTVDNDGVLAGGGSGGGGTQYTEDDPASSNPTGNAQILVRKDTPASEVSADGDNIAQRGTAHGAAYVSLLDTSGNPVAVGGGTQYTEDAPAASDPVGNALMLVRRDTLSASEVSANGDNVAAKGTSKGELHTKNLDQEALTGAVNESAPGSDTASSGLNGRLQRIAQRLTTAIASLATLATESTVSAISGDLGDVADAESSSGDGTLIAIAKRLRTLLGTLVGTTGTISSTSVIKVAVFDDNDTQVTSFGGAGGSGTEYTEDAPAASNPVGGALMLVRKDTLASEVSADGDNVATRGTSKGEVYVKHVDTLPISAASLPLPSGAATSAKQDTAQTALDAIKTAVELIDNPVATIGTTPLLRVAIFDDSDTQITSFSGGGGGSYPAPQTRSDTYTATGAGTAIDATATGQKHFALQVTETGTVSAWTVTLEGSLDGTTYTTLLTHTKAGDGSGVTITQPQPLPMRYFRSNCTALTLGGGTNVVARILGMN